MTLLLWLGLGAFLSGTVFDLSVPTAHAGWEYTETARPKKRHGIYPKPAAPHAQSPRSTGTDSTAAESAPRPRIQVFGRPAPEMTVDDYARMLKEDAAVNSGGAPVEARAPDPTVEVAPAPAVDGRTDQEFEALRARIRTRQVAESEGETESDAEPARPKKGSRARSGSARAKPAYVPPPPAMETEVITPQKPVGKKVRGAKAEPATEPEGARGDEVNAAFPFTHLLPSPFNIGRGDFVFGTTVAYGVFDFLQVSTNVASLIQNQWNVQAKVPLVEYPTFVATGFVDYRTFNPHHIDDGNPDLTVKRWQPGLVTGYEITPDIAFFLGGNFNFGKEAPEVLTTSGYLKGAEANMEWSWLYNPSTSRLGNNAISIGMKYDFTYDMFGFGFTHHWRMFEAGVHYTFADRNRFLPIFGFNVAASF